MHDTICHELAHLKYKKDMEKAHRELTKKILQQKHHLYFTIYKQYSFKYKNIREVL